VRNRSAGFYGNHQIGGGDWFNNTAFSNPVNFNMLERLPDNVTDIPGIGQKMRNNLGFRGRIEITNLNAEKSDARRNSFDIAGLKLTDRDFVSLDDSQLAAPRKPDGGLPDITLMHPAPGSAVIDAGEDCGFPFKGQKPDLGAFEYGE
jgi:pectate lyase